MAQYATPQELASYLQMDLDAATADLALTLASGTFASEADTYFTAQTVSYSVTVCAWVTRIDLPYKPVTAVSAVRLNGAVTTGWTLRKDSLYRAAGFGTWNYYMPDLLEVDLTHGYTTVPDDAKLAVLEIAAGLYEHPTNPQSESIDDYTVRYQPGTAITPGRPWRDVAADYRGVIAA